MDRAALKAAAKKSIKGNLGVLFLINLLMHLISGVIGMVPIVGAIASALILGGFSLALADIYLNVSRDIKPAVSDLFGHMKRLLTGFCAAFLMGLFMFLWSFLLLIPGMIKACAYSQTMYILAEDRHISPMAAIKKSQRMMKGHKMEYFLLSLSFVGWAILGVFTLGILWIWLVPYINTAAANFYRSVKSQYTGE